MKITETIDGYFLDKKLEFSPRTVGNYDLFFRYFVEFTGDPDIESVATKTIRLFLVYLKEKRNYSDRSIHDAWVALSSLWTWVETELKIDHVIRGQIKIRNIQIRRLTRLQQRKLRSCLERQSIQPLGKPVQESAQRANARLINVTLQSF